MPDGATVLLTIFSIPKPFRGHTGLIQDNAIRSWMALGGGCRVVLFGSEPGTAEAAERAGVTHVPRVARNRYGTPLLHDLFAQAEVISPDPWLCYINADIILMSDFLDAVQRVVSLKRRCLVVGRRWDVDLTEPVTFNQRWEDDLRRHVDRHGRIKAPTNIDYFVFNRGLWGSIPPFAVGRTAFDNWLIYRARCLRVPVVDVTPAVTAVHQNHDYNHAGSGYRWVWRGPEARANYALAGGRKHLYTIWDSTHILTDRGLEQRRGDGLGGGIWSYRRSAANGI